MNVRDIIYIFSKRMKLVAFVPVIFAIAGYLISAYAISPVYEATSELLVNQTKTSEEGSVSTTDVDMNLSLLETYRAIIESPRVRELVHTELEEAYSTGEIEESLEVETHSKKQIISLIVRESDPQSASELANTYADISQQEIIDLMNLDNVKVMTQADADSIKSPVSPRPLLHTVVAFLAGFLFVIMYIALSAYFNTKILSDADVEKYLQLPVIGHVGTLRKQNKTTENKPHPASMIELAAHSNVNQSVKEAFRHLRVNIHFQASTTKMNALVVTSSEKNEGKTTIACNLALATAHDEKKTLLVNADLRKLEEKDVSSGLSTYLSGYSSLDDIIHASGIPHLSMISNGPLPPNPTELLSSSRMDAFLAEAGERFDTIIFDSAPMVFSDALVLASKVDGTIYVSEVNQTKVSVAQKAITQLEMAEATMLGVVLNNKKEKVKNEVYYYA